MQPGVPHGAPTVPHLAQGLRDFHHEAAHTAWNILYPGTRLSRTAEITEERVLQFFANSYSVLRSLHLCSTNAILTWVCLKLGDTSFLFVDFNEHRIFGHSTVVTMRCQGTRLRARSKSLEDSWEFTALSSWGSVGICWDLLGSVGRR